MVLLIKRELISATEIPEIGTIKFPFWILSFKIVISDLKSDPVPKPCASFLLPNTKPNKAANRLLIDESKLEVNTQGMFDRKASS